MGIIPQLGWKKPRRLLLMARFFELELFDPIANLVPVQAKKYGGACLVPTSPRERLNKQ
jgi:hypothetical protein